MKRLAVFVTGLVLAACAPTGEPGAEEAPVMSPLAADQSAPLLALADHMLAEYFASDIANRPTTCLSTSDGREDVALSPDDELALMQRHEALAPFARCAWTPEGWTDQESGEPAIVFSVRTLTCASDSECTAWGSYTAGMTASPSSLYTMHYNDGAWSFERDDRLLGDR